MELYFPYCQGWYFADMINQSPTLIIQSLIAAHFFSVSMLEFFYSVYLKKIKV